MRVLAVDSLESLNLAGAIDNFEQQFSYPLGTATRFRISHGDNYSGFYRSMGKSQSLIAEQDGVVYGAIAAALRVIHTPHGASIKAAYIGDFKVSEQVRGRRVAYRLLQETQQWIASATNYGFCVVMNGTVGSPLEYTGRLGITEFEFLGEVTILRISNLGQGPAVERSMMVTLPGDASLLYKNLTAGRWSMLSGVSMMRSTMKPQWLATINHSACGLIEDTRKAKRLFTLDNQEILSAHLSNFAYLNPSSGAAVIQMALKYAAHYGYKSIFVAVNTEDVPFFLKLLAPCEIAQAQASIFGNLPASVISTRQWSINTAEI